MNDLFRFLLLRPADLPKPDATRPLVANFFERAPMRRSVAARQPPSSPSTAEMRAEALVFGDVAEAVSRALAKRDRSPPPISRQWPRPRDDAGYPV